MGGFITDVVASITGPPFSAFTSNPSLNHSGLLAFTANLDAGGDGIFTQASGGSPLEAYKTGVSYGGFTFGGFSNPDLADDGTLAFRGGYLGGSTTGIFKGDGAAPTLIASTGGGPPVFGPTPAISSSGQYVAFMALSLDLDGPGGAPGINGVFRGDGTTIATIATTAGPYASFDTIALDVGPTVNSSGMVAFFAALDGGDSGIFIGPDPIADRIIGTGDTISPGGPTVTQLRFHRDGLNDLGQIAFWAKFSDGTQGIYRAEGLSTSVPEPGTLVLMGVGLIGFALLRPARRR
jgi:hypothetical protein